MTNTKEITRLLMRHYFKGRYFDLYKDDVILNTIQVYEIRDEELGRQVPFDIQVAGEDEYRIVPNSSNYEFFIAYYCLVKTRKIVIKAEDIPRYKNMNVSMSISFDKNGTIIN